MVLAYPVVAIIWVVGIYISGILNPGPRNTNSIRQGRHAADKQIEKVFESPKDSRVTSEVSIDEYSQSSHKHSSEALEELE